MAGCSDDLSELVSPAEQGITRIYATIDDEVANTRTMLVNDQKLFWEKGDGISVIPTDDLSGAYYPFEYQGDGYFNYGDIKGGIPAGTYYATYPTLLGANDDPKQLFMILDENVVYKENSFSQPMPMFAGSTNFASGNLSFNLAAGAIKVSLAGTFKVTKITLKGNNNEQLTGVGTLNVAEAKPSLELTNLAGTIGETPFGPGYQQEMTMGSGVQLSESPTSFYFVVAPTDFTKGITVTIEGEGLSHPIVKTTTSSVKVERGVMKSFTVVDTQAILKEEADAQIDALKALYNSLGGANWTKKWDLSKPLSEKAAWPGVTADANGLVTKIDLSSNGLKGTLPAELGKLTSLTDINLSANTITGGIPKEVSEMTHLQSFNVKDNQMNDSVPYVVYTSDAWAYAKKELTQQAGYALKTKYVSNDYSKDGVTKQILKHDRGGGIPVVITGEAFTDNMVDEFNTQAAKAMDYFFTIAPYKDYKNYFDVYTLVSVSPNNEVGLNLPYATAYDEGSYSIDTDKVRKKIEEKTGLSSGYLLSIVLLNETQEVKRARCFMVSDGFAAAIVPVDEDMECIIRHEAGGHGFAFLADEYSSDGEKTYGAEEKAELDKLHDIGWSLNLSYLKGQTEVPWTDFWTDAAYNPEAVGAYEGGDAAYKYGVYRSTDKSTMNSQYEFDKFNPQSRWLIYKQICDRAGVAATMDNFKAYDKVNNITAAPLVSAMTRNYVEKKEHKLGAPPKYIFK